MLKPLIVYLPEGFADWEGAFLLPELRENKRPLKIVSENGKPVLSIGGLIVQVEGSLDGITVDNSLGLVLIGSDSWPDAGKNRRVLELAREFLERGSLVAGICASTVALAREGLLQGRKHTSNDLEWLKKIVPSYQDEKNYVEKPAVADGNLITASGTGPLEFTLEVMRFLDLYSETKRQQWYAMYKNGTKPPAEFWA